MEPLNSLLNQKSKSTGKHSTPNIKRCSAYIRVSTEEQTLNPEGSIKSQEERIKQAIHFKNMNTEFGTLNRVFIDAGLSGKDMNRPELRRLLELVANGEIDMIIVSDLSRLSRSIRDFSQIWEFLQAHHCQLWSLRENFDTSTAAGEMMLYSIANFSQYERKQTAERVSANFQSRASRGLHNGGTIPLGYEPDPEKRGHLRIKEHEAKVVRAAFLALLKEGSIAGAARSLNQNGISCEGKMLGAGSRERLKTFNVGNLTYLLTNPSYVGIRHYHQPNGKVQESKAAWPAIIDEELFEMAKKTIQGSKKRKLSSEKRYPYLLTGKVVCSECGKPMMGKSAHGRAGKIPYYEHGSQSRRESCIPVEQRSKKCFPYRIQARALEQRVFDEIEKLLRNPKLSKDLFAKIEKKGSAGNGNEIIELKSNLGRSETKIQSLLSRLAELPSHIPATTIYREIERHQDEKKTIENKILELQKQVPEESIIDRMNYEQFLVRLVKMLHNDTSYEMKRAIINAIIHKIEITPKGFKMGFYVGVGQIKKGEALASPLISLNNNFLSDGSFLLKNGWGARIRTLEWRNQNPLAYHLPTPQQISLPLDWQYSRNNIGI